MKKIWKYELKGLDEQVIMMPKGSVIIAGKVLFNVPVIYAIIDAKEKEMEAKSVTVFGTGHDIDINITSWTYLDTIMTHNDNLVWHIFYK